MPVFKFAMLQFNLTKFSRSHRDGGG